MTVKLKQRKKVFKCLKFVRITLADKWNMITVKTVNDEMIQ